MISCVSGGGYAGGAFVNWWKTNEEARAGVLRRASMGDVDAPRSAGAAGSRTAPAPTHDEAMSYAPTSSFAVDAADLAPTAQHQVRADLAHHPSRFDWMYVRGAQ